MLPKPVEETSPYQLAQLPYAPTALEPHLSRETIEYHYGRHHRGYVDNLNALVPGSPYDGFTLDDLVRRASGPVYRNAAQAWNHDFYWRCMTPQPLPGPIGRSAHAIASRFGSPDAFAAEFRKSALAKFASGWTWLVRKADDTLEIVNTDDADNPLRSAGTPLLVCDVWEHAYYIDYRNERGRYVDAFWKIVDWRAVEQNYLR